MSDVVREILIGALGSLLGALLGSLGTIVAFGGRVSSLEGKTSQHDKDIERAENAAAKASADANRIGSSFREVVGELRGAGVTGTHPKYEPRNSGEGSSVG